MTETKRKTWIVDESGAGDYRTLTEAVAACAATPDEPVRFYIRHGIYEERPFIELADYVIEGEYRGASGISGGVGGRDRGPGAGKGGAGGGAYRGRCPRACGAGVPGGRHPR